KANEFYERTKDDTSHYTSAENTWIFTTYKLLEHDADLKELCLSLFRKNKDIHANSSDALFHLGNGFAEIGNIDSAKLYMNATLQLNPNNSHAKNFLKSLKE